MATSRFVALENIEEVLSRKVEIPTVVLWNRLEARPRKENFIRALRAEVRDPLWMLCKQWQVGEFKGDDAGSPIVAKAHITTTKLTRYKPGLATGRAFDNQVPLEATVEQRPVPFFGQEHVLSLDIRLAMGRHWIKLLATPSSNDWSTLAPLFIDRYGVDEPDPNARSDAHITAHATVWATLSALAGRAMDGAKLYFHLRSAPGTLAYDDMVVPDASKPDLDTLAAKFVEWYERLLLQPALPQPAGAEPEPVSPGVASGDAWLPEQLEYQFSVSAPKGTAHKVMVAEEYYHGHLDWYNLDVDAEADSLPLGEPDELGETEALPDEASAQGSLTYSFFPTTIQFQGMPNTRWWSFEDSKTNFGDIKPDTTDINKLLLMEFGLIYANDWFLVPVQLPAGSLANVAGLAVTNVFGERTWVRASGSGADEDWQRWSMYTLAVRGDDDVAVDTTLVLLPTVPKIQEAKPFDDVLLARDEVANMVWGVEMAIPLATGASKRGHEAARELSKRLQTLLDGEIEGGSVVPEISEPAAAIRYELMHGVPENFIPFIPVHKPGDNREIQLQRASMPRILQGDPAKPKKIKPRTVLLRQGLTETPPTAYFIHEEEVPRAGVRVTQSFQRTRWHDGSVFTWVGVRKQTGRGEGNSGLAFDRVKSTK